MPASKSKPTGNTTASTLSSLHFFGGKGGVGKTTCAAACAVGAARSGRRVLVLSTDPAHSLGDALGVRLTARVARLDVGRAHAVHAVEVDAHRAFGRWLAAHRPALGDILEHGTWLDRADVDALLNLSVPGIDELMGLREVARHAASGKYDDVVIDTAPTGHTLRMLTSPDAVRSAAAALEALQHEHRVIREQLARVRRPERADRLIAMLEGEAVAIATLLRNRTSTTINWVTVPEPLAVLETTDALNALERDGLTVAALIINRVTPPGAPCPICDVRRAAEAAVIRRLRTACAVRLLSIAAQPREPRGLTALRAIAAELREAIAPVARGGVPRRRAVSAARSPSPLRSSAIRGAKILFCGGKGGVGKTTVAAAVALRLARQASRPRVLLLSTDPAHSLADVFDAAVGDEARPVGGAPANLHLRELDAAAALAARRVPLEAALQTLGESLGGMGVAVSSGVTGLIDLAPPGIDELLGMLTVLEAQDAYDAIVTDTAPTGHALRLLEMPEIAREWLQALMRVMLKYRTVVGPGTLAAELVALSRQIRSLQDVLRDRSRTRFLVVTRAAELPRRETERLLRALRRLHIAVPLVIVNAVTLDPGECRRCRATHAAERRQLAALRRTVDRYDCAIIQSPLAAPPPQGVESIERWARAWIV